VSFLFKSQNLLEMKVIDVSIDTEESLEDLFHCLREVLWEDSAHLRGKSRLVREGGFDPFHEVFNVFWSREAGSLLVFLSICPQVLIAGRPSGSEPTEPYERLVHLLGTSVHDRTALTRAIFSYGGVQHIGLGVEVCSYELPRTQR
jgi:hypothetical protein